jgi:hypothetical protein
VVSVKIPQVLSGALGAAVYTCLAQRAGTYLLESGGPAPSLFSLVGRSPIWFDWATAVVLLLWTTKNLVDDFKAFETDPDQAFNLLLTVFFSAGAYTLLALAASTLFRGALATQILFVYFVILALWSFCSWLRRCRRPERDAIAREKLRRRGWWVILYGSCATSVAAALWLNSPLVFIVIVGAIYIYDCKDCGTYTLANTHGI